jgi:hypothetical protein
MNAPEDPETGKKTRPTLVLCFALEDVLSVFRPVYKKIRFPNKGAAIDGLWHIAKTGWVRVDYPEDDVYGLRSPRQIQALEDHKIPYEVVRD